MFAAILDRYPGAEPNLGAEPNSGAAPNLRAPGEDRRARIEHVLRAQFDAGMGMLGDGVVWDVSGSADEMDVAVAGWNAANDVARGLAAAETPSAEAPLVKACLLGPWTAIHRSERKRELGKAAKRTHQAVELLFDAGAAVVQLVEDAFVRLDPEESASVAAAHEALMTATRSQNGHVSLSAGGGNVDRLGPAFFFDLPVASYAFDLINGPDNWRLITRAPADRGILCGVADCRTADDDEEAVMIWAARYAASTNDRGLQRVGLCPSSGLGALSPAGAARKLGGLASASRKAGLPPDELAGAIDPRAVDARSAALGRYDPPNRSPR